MSYYNNFPSEALPVQRPAVNVQEMLRWVYLWMALGLFVTAGVAYMTVNTPALLSLLTGPAVLIAFVVELILVFSLAAALPRLSPGVAAVMFFAYSALNGFVLASIFLIYEIGTITAAFGATAALFGAMTIVGFTTKLDLTRMRTFLMMGLIGLVIAMVVNMFIASSGLDLIISIVGVLIFTALTAYDTQKLQRIAANPTIQSDGSLAMKLSILGALTLYLDFINLFLFLLRILGGGRRS